MGGQERVAVEIQHANNPVVTQMMQVVQAMVAEAGFDVTLRATEFATLLSEQTAGNFQLSRSDWSGRPDPDGNLHQFVTCEGGINDPKYCNPEVDRLLNEARAVTDPAALRAERARNDDGGFLRWTLRQVPEVQGAFMAMDVNTGRVMAMQGGFSYQSSVFNRATQAQRQPGSSFKPFIYSAALDAGFTAASLVNDAPIILSDDYLSQKWRPKNDNNTFLGPIRMREALYKSRNLVSIRLLQAMGVDRTIEILASQVEQTMKLLQAPTLADLGPQHVTQLGRLTRLGVVAARGALGPNLSRNQAAPRYKR